MQGRRLQLRPFSFQRYSSSHASILLGLFSVIILALAYVFWQKAQQSSPQESPQACRRGAATFFKTRRVGQHPENESASRRSTQS